MRGQITVHSPAEIQSGHAHARTNLKKIIRYGDNYFITAKQAMLNTYTDVALNRRVCSLHTNEQIVRLIMQQMKDRIEYICS